MNTLEFFDKILPQSGVRVLVELIPLKGGGEYKHHTSYETNAEMAAAALEIDGRKRVVYHACSTFKGWFDVEEDGKTKQKIRRQENVLACRSLYDDIDINKPDKDTYPTKRAAVDALKEFLQKSGVPSPLIVSSGGGFHLYWPMTRDIEPALWQRMALLKSAVTTAFGLKIDPSVNRDTARVLKPVGTHWRKKGEREVKVLYDAGPYEPEALLVAFEKAVAVNDLAIVPAYGQGSNGDDFSSANYPPSSLVTVAEHCAQVRAMRDTKGDVGYDHWRGVIGLAKYATEGVEVAEEWSEQRAATGHSQVNVSEKFATWSTGPTTCEFFKRFNPAGCDGCVHTVKTPLQLGYSATAEIAAAPAESTEEAAEPAGWPRTVRKTDLGLAMSQKDDNGVVRWVLFARPAFHPIGRVKLADGTYAMRMRMEVRPGSWREFDLPTKAIADKRSMRTELAKYEITITDDVLTTRFMHDYLAYLRQNSGEADTFTQFGWKRDYTAFLVGSHLITKDEIHKVRLGDAVRDPDLQRAFELKGTPEIWTDAVNRLYDRPNGEPYQYAIATGFGAVLAPLLNRDDWHGIPLALTSSDSGLGKSTVCRLVLNIYGANNRMLVADTTPKAICARASIMNHLPALFDEVAHIFPEVSDLQEICYALSAGKRKVGLRSDGTERESLAPWDVMSLMTGNKNIHFQLGGMPNNPEAVQMRVLEIDLGVYPRLDTITSGGSDQLTYGELAANAVNGSYGVVGVEYLRWVMGHLDVVREQLQKACAGFTRALGAAAASKGRFFIYHMTCAMVGVSIAKHMGLVSFDLNALREWILDHVRVLMKQIEERRVGIHDMFSRFLSDMQGGILITKAYESLDTRKQRTELPMLPCRSAVRARLVLGSETERGRLLVEAAAFDEWCRKNRLDPRGFRKELHEARLMKREADGAPVRASLSRGVPTHPSAQCRVYEFEYAAAQGYIDDVIAPNHPPGSITPIVKKEASA